MCAVSFVDGIKTVYSIDGGGEQGPGPLVFFFLKGFVDDIISLLGHFISLLGHLSKQGSGPLVFFVFLKGFWWATPVFFVF